MEPPKIWRERRHRYIGIGVECLDCESKSFPYANNCFICGSNNIREYKISEQGKIIQFSQVNQTAQEMMMNVPYTVGIIELDDGIRLTGQIVDIDYSDVKTGMKVRRVLRILAKDGNEGLIKYGFKFVPLINP